MHRQGFDLQLTQYNERGWRATFYTTGMVHSSTSATGTAWEHTPRRSSRPPLAPLAAHRPRPARDVAHPMERAGVARRPCRIPSGARAAEWDQARGVV